MNTTVRAWRPTKASGTSIDHDDVHRRAFGSLEHRRQCGQLSLFAIVKVVDLALRGESRDYLSCHIYRHRSWPALLEETGQRERFHREQIARTDGARQLRARRGNANDDSQGEGHDTSGRL